MNKHLLPSEPKPVPADATNSRRRRPIEFLRQMGRRIPDPPAASRPDDRRDREGSRDLRGPVQTLRIRPGPSAGGHAASHRHSAGHHIIKAAR